MSYSFGEEMKLLMKRIILATGIILLVLIIAVVVIMYPRFSNMGSEYATADAIHSIEEYVRSNDGQWPASAKELHGARISSEDVFIDYTVTSSELIADPDRLRKAIRPQSGKFYTYPYYEKKLEFLLRALQETGTEQGIAPDR